MQRDGMTMEQVARAFDVKIGELGVTRQNFESFLRQGRELLAQRIREGLEPAESVITVDLPEDEVDGPDDDDA